MEYAKSKHLDVEIVNKRESVYEMLKIGRFDLAVDTRLEGIASLQTQKLSDKIIETGTVLFAEPVYLVLSHKHRDWAPRIQKAFDAAILKGTWQESVRAVNVALGIPKDMGMTCLKK